MFKSITASVGIMSLLIQNTLALTPQATFDWATLLTIPTWGTPTTAGVTEGSQVLHFKSKNKSLDEQAQAFITNFLSSAKPLTSDADILRYASDSVSITGSYLEMGVCTGKTVNFIGALNPHQKIYGFDSFEGLPEAWIRGDISTAQGVFGFKNPEQMPPVLNNIVLFKGWFKDTLPTFKQELLKNTPIAFLHIDSDLYSAAKTIFDELGDNIVDGTIIVFDEFYNYPGCENHEMKAFNEFLVQRALTAEYLAYNIYHEQVAVRIKI